MPATTYLRNKLADHVLRHVAYTSPTNSYLALFTTATDETGAGTEVVGGSYARVAMTAKLAASSGGDCVSNVDAVFATMPACTITDMAIMDASTSGNMLIQWALDFPEEVGAGDTITWPSGSLTFSVR